MRNVTPRRWSTSAKHAYRSLRNIQPRYTPVPLPGTDDTAPFRVVASSQRVVVHHGDIEPGFLGCSCLGSEVLVRAAWPEWV